MNTKLGNANINKLLWELSIPAILGMLSGAIFNVVDRIFVGRISINALSAVGITMPIQILHMAFILLIGIGASALVSIRLGENDKESAEDILFLSFKYIVISMGLFSVVFLLFSHQILTIFNIPPELYDMAHEYIFTIIVGGVFGIPGYCLNNSLRAMGKANVTMKIILISSILNIILDPIFIFTLDLGVRGAALATVISQTVLTIYVTVYLICSKNTMINLRFKKVRGEFSKVIEIIKSGSPPFFVQLFATFVNIFINNSILKYGNESDIGAVLIASTIFGFYTMVVHGIVQGNQPICGYNFGAKNYERVRKSLKLSLIYAFILSLGVFLIIMIYPVLLVSPFLESPEMLDETIKITRLYLMMIPLVGLHTISSQYFISVGKSRLSSILSLLRYGVILVPLVLILAPVFGVDGIYASYAISDFLASSIAIFFIIRELSKLQTMSLDKNIKKLEGEDL